MAIEAICWRRIDTPGHDVCRLKQVDQGWRLDGAAVFQHENEPARLAYCLMCDRHWRTREGIVCGWVGERNLELRIARSSDGLWRFNDETTLGLDGCLDLDLGFTPATNLSQLRRIALKIGQAADVPVAWLDLTTVTLGVLHQRYERRGPEVYWYEAARFNYAAELAVRSSGFIRRYPGLWEEEER